MHKLNNWERVTLNQVAELKPGSLVDGPFGSNLKTNEYSDDGIRLIQLQNIGDGFWINDNQKFIPLSKFNELSRHAAYPGDIAIAKMADPVARACILPSVAKKFLVVADCIKLAVDHSKYDPRYIVYAINYSDFRRQAEYSSSGTTRQRINLSVLKKITLWAPPLAEQYHIADILNTIDTQIQCTEQLIAKLNLQKIGLLQDLLSCGLDKYRRLRDPIAYPEQFKDSVLGMLPKEWEVVQVGQLAETITSGSRGWAMYYSNSGSLFLRISNLTREHVHLRLHDLMYVSPPANSEGARTAVKPGDVLISITAELGLIGVIPSIFETAYVNQHIALVRFNRSVYPEYVANYLAGETGQKQFRRLNDSGAKAGLNLGSIANLLFPLPPIQEQIAISDAINSVEVIIRIEEEHLVKLKLYKKGLMQNLLSGYTHVDTK